MAHTEDRSEELSNRIDCAPNAVVVLVVVVVMVMIVRVAE
jgi:hypothetical protein